MSNFSAFRFVFKFLCTLIAFTGIAQAAPYAREGKPTTFQQPNGTTIELLVKGSQYYARTETKDGHTVAYVLSDKAYYYAQLDATGDNLIPTTLIVGRDQPKGLEKHIRINPKKRKEIWTKEYSGKNAHQIKRWEKRVEAAKVRRAINKQLELNQLQPTSPTATKTFAAPAPPISPALAPVSGAKTGLTILCQFPDDPNTPDIDPAIFPTTQTKITRYCNEIGYTDDGNAGSVRDYFLDQSLNQIDYTMSVTPVVNLPHPKDYYNYSNYPTNTAPRGAAEAGNLIITDAINDLKASGFNFDSVTVEDGKVLSTNLLYAGPPTGIGTNGLWPHRSQMSTPPQVSVNGSLRDIFQYQITDTPDDAPAIGTFVHESGHLLCDFPDLYDTENDSEGIGNHGLMGGGGLLNGRLTPGPMNIYLKDIIGWANITDLTPTEQVDATLPTTGNVGYRIRKPGASNEYFLVENRGDGDKWAQHTPDKGIMIWHVDENVSGNNFQQRTEAQHYEISLEQSDNAFQLEENSNSGDSNDLFDNLSNFFTDTTFPNAKWWDGTDSSIRILVTSAPGSTMGVTFGFSNTIAVAHPNGGDSLAAHQSFDIKWAGNILGDVNIDLFKDGSFLQSIATNEANDGSYTWNLAGSFNLGTGYSIRVSSAINSSISDYSDSTFAIHAEVFPALAQIPTGFTKPSDTTKGWVVASDEATQGALSLKNDNIGDDQSAGIEYTTTHQSGNVTFDTKVSSELNYDQFKFYIDGVEQNINAADSIRNGLSGEVPWQSLSIPVSVGTHTYKWVYSKDTSSDAGQDSAWIDKLVFPDPISANSIFVVSPNGGESIHEDQTTEIKWINSSNSNVNIDLYKGGIFHQSIATNEINDGSYLWILAKQYTVGSDYSIRISNGADTISDTSDANFSISLESFPAGEIFPSGFITSSGADQGWIVATDHVSEGKFSLKNEDISDNQTASVEHTVDLPAGSISFDTKVSSEGGFDHLRFYIDDVEQRLSAPNSTSLGASGDTGWRSHSYEVTAGTHTYKWSYSKDSSGSSNDDTAWIDNLVLPAPLSGIALWKQNQFNENSGNDAIAGEGADPDGDQISNMLEYALNLDPNVRDDSTGVTLSKTSSDVSLTYPKNQNATDLNYIVEYSLTLKGDSWQPATVSEQILSTSGTTDIMKADIDFGSEEKYFLRLKVELN